MCKAINYESRQPKKYFSICFLKISTILDEQQKSHIFHLFSQNFSDPRPANKNNNGCVSINFTHERATGVSGDSSPSGYKISLETIPDEAPLLGRYRSVNAPGVLLIPAQGAMQRPSPSFVLASLDDSSKIPKTPRLR